MVTTERSGQNVVYALADERVILALDIMRAVLADVLLRRESLVRASGLGDEPLPLPPSRDAAPYSHGGDTQ